MNYNGKFGGNVTEYRATNVELEEAGDRISLEIRRHIDEISHRGAVARIDKSRQRFCRLEIDAEFRGHRNTGAGMDPKTETD